MYKSFQLLGWGVDEGISWLNFAQRKNGGKITISVDHVTERNLFAFIFAKKNGREKSIQRNCIAMEI
jgi:hypothetical protein